MIDLDKDFIEEDGEKVSAGIEGSPTSMSYLSSVEVSWKDSTIPCVGDEWHDVSDIPNIVKTAEETSQYHHTIGIYVGEAYDRVFIAQSISDNNNVNRDIQVRNVIAIDKRNICRIRALQ